MKRLGSWGIAGRLMVLGLLGALLAAVPTVFYLQGAIGEIRLAHRERDAIVPVKSLLALIHATQNHRGVSAGMLAGNAALVSEREARAAAVLESLRRFDAQLKESVGDEKILDRWKTASASWDKIAAGVGNRSLSTDDSYGQHTALIAEYLVLLNAMSDHYRISMDRETSGVAHLPKLVETLGQLRARGMVLLTQKLATGDDNFTFTKLLGLAKMHYDDVAQSVEKAMAASPESRQNLAPIAEEALKQAQVVMRIADRHIAQTDNLSYPAADYFAAFSNAMKAQVALDEATLVQLDTVLAHRIATEQRNLAIVVGAICAVTVMALLLGMAIGRSVTRPLRQAVTIAEKVAAGDLTSEIEVRSRDEVGQLLLALKTMNESLRRIAHDVRGGTEAILSASNQLASGNADLSQRTEEQASSLEETASSMEELTSTVKQNADNAAQANQLAAGASDVAAEGGRVVGQVVETMSSINESARRIVDIISVIDGIAFQTNILALNAAVEAARAGEQGRGFAVVAGEVRNLAQRSAGAAKEIKGLIEDSVSKVKSGSELVDRAGKTMDEVVAAVKRVTHIIGEIAAASHEQTSGIEQVNRAIGQMDEVTQQNAALVEEAAAAAESMEEQAQRLTEAVARFKTGDITAADTAVEAAPAAVANVTTLPHRERVIALPGRRKDAAA
jgi:methyl-accepting chemotaxis protein